MARCTLPERRFLHGSYETAEMTSGVNVVAKPGKSPICHQNAKKLSSVVP